MLDTKYKAPEKPSSHDIYQVVTYAEAVGCCEAILVYPVQLPAPIDSRIGDIRVRSATFGVDGDLELAGVDFLESALSCRLR